MPSKLWPHILRPTAAARFWIEAGCTGVKCVGDFGASNEIPSGATIIGREISHYPNDPGREITGENLRHLDPKVAAKFFVDVQAPKYFLNPKVQFWEGVNEPQWTWNDRVKAREDVAWYAQFEIERIKQLKLSGLRAVIGNWSVGIPDIDENKLDLWLEFLPALRVAASEGCLLGLHEYSVRPFALEVDLRGEGWTVFRFVKVHRLILEPNGLGNLGVVLTEFGIDFRNRSEINYTDELIWADKQFRKYPWFKGACVYTFGQFEGWQPYNLEGSEVAEKVATYIRHERNVEDVTVPNTPPPTIDFAKGVDVSDHQGVIDWARVKGNDISFAMIRVSDGVNRLDTQFKDNWEETNRVGIIRGAYQFFRPAQDAEAQAELFLSKVKLTDGDLPPILDVEVFDDVSLNTLVFQVNKWLSIVSERTGVVPIIYTSAGFWNQVRVLMLGIDTKPVELWVAHWTTRSAPLLPGVWSTWRFWQHTNSGLVPGIQKPVDLDRYNGTVEQLRQYAASIHPIIPNDRVQLIREALENVEIAKNAVARAEDFIRRLV